MNIKELNKLIKEELASYLKKNENYINTTEGDDEIEVTTDEPAEEEDPLELLRQIYDLIRPQVEDDLEDDLEGEEELEDLGDGGVEDVPLDGEEDEIDTDEEELDETILKESINFQTRFQRLANIKK